MTTNTTLASKLQAVTENETRLLAAIQANRAQASGLDTQYKQLEEQRHVFAGAKLILEELQKEASADVADTPAPCAEDCGCVVEPMPAQT